ncbi:hypothetical protein [Intrasporangium sp. YIM S08009]|uniref:hypothetical protein n=1 Tax=Intrasporangium zincisolvens TaxID=3080018 RepID=UPI002B054054|nr:hypothetical protein [Intrasporangium sp. YIM S08009]
MIRNTLWVAATGIALALTLAYPTSANQGVPYGRTAGATVKSKPSPAKPVSVTPAPAASSRSPK